MPGMGSDAWGRRWLAWQEQSLTLFAKTVLILVAELAANALLWIIAAIVFTRAADTQHRVLGLALVAWTTGLRHGLDADHISGECSVAQASAWMLMMSRSHRQCNATDRVGASAGS